VEEFTAGENAALYLSWLRFHATVVKRKLPHLTRTTARTDMTSIHCYVYGQTSLIHRIIKLYSM